MQQKSLPGEYQCPKVIWLNFPEFLHILEENNIHLYIFKMLSTKKVSLSKMDEHKRWFPLQEINIHTPHGLLTWKLEVNLNGICWKLKKKKMYNIVLSIIHVHVMGKTDRKKNLRFLTKIVGILHWMLYFSFFSIFSPSQCCLLQFTHQILSTSIGRARRQ